MRPTVRSRPPVSRVGRDAVSAGRGFFQRHVHQYVPRRGSRQVDGKDAALILVTPIEPAIVRFDTPSTERQADAESAPVGPSLLKGPKQRLGVTTRQAAALVL